MQVRSLSGVPLSKTLFLDFDGVLNNKRTYFTDAEDSKIDANNIASLNLVTDMFGQYISMPLDIVVTSTWRKTNTPDQLAYILTRAGLRNFRIVGVTPILHKSRGCEIQDWLISNMDRWAGDYCILDDDPSMLSAQKPYWVQTSFDSGGMTPDHARQVLTILFPPKL